MSKVEELQLRLHSAYGLLHGLAVERQDNDIYDWAQAVAEANVLLREQARQLEQLRPRDSGIGSTHWKGCHEARGHHDCALAELEEARRERDEQMSANAIASAALDTQAARVEVLEAAVRFFASVIKSGERWSPECQHAYLTALHPTEEPTTTPEGAEKQ